MKLPDGDASGDDARFEAFISKELAPWVKILDSPPSESGGQPFDVRRNNQSW